MAVAAELSKRATCLKASVGCVLCDSRGRVLSTGYNGVARGQHHCNAVGYVNPAVPASRRVVFKDPFAAHGAVQRINPTPCAGAAAPSGADLCEAIHAEANALTQCPRPDDIHTAYVTMAPCMRCAKELLNTGMRKLVFGRVYAAEPQALLLLRRSNIQIIQLGTDGGTEDA